MKRAPIPDNLPPLAMGFIAKHPDRAGMLAYYGRDGLLTNSYPAGYDIHMIREAFSFGPCELLDNGHVVLRPPPVVEVSEE